MKRNNSSSLSAPGAFMLVAGIAAVAFVSTQVIAARSGVGVRLAQAAAPAVSIQAAPGTVEYWPIAGSNKTLLSFTLRNDGSENVTVTGLTFYVSSTPRNANLTSTPALLNYKLRNAVSGVQYGTTIWRASLSPSPNYAQVSWPSLSITVPSRGMVSLVVNNDVANVGAALAPLIAGTKHDALLVSSDPILPVSIAARGAVSGTGATVSGTAVSGMKTVLASVLHAGLNSTSPNGAAVPANEQIIAKFSLWHEDRGLRSPTIGGWTGFTFDSNITVRAPRSLRIYRDSVAAANLLGTVALRSALLGSQRPDLNLAPWIVNGTQAVPSVLVITMDTRDAAPGNWLSARLSFLEWTDSYVHLYRTAELPVAANYLRY